jgi:hypothetical protein
MKNSMATFGLTKVLGLALGGAVLVLGGISASAEAFHGNGGTAFVMTPLTPTTYHHVVDGVVRISLLGDCTIHGDVIVKVPTATDPTHWPMVGTITFTTADGTRILTATGTGLCTSGTTKYNPSGVYGILDFHYDLEFVNGASGSFKIDGFAFLALNPGSLYVAGEPDTSVGTNLITPSGAGDLTGKACWLTHGDMNLGHAHGD